MKTQSHEKFNSDPLVQTGEHDACLDSEIDLYVFGRSGVEHISADTYCARSSCHRCEAAKDLLHEGCAQQV